MNCRRHPSSQDCPGVCAACLRDRLSDLLGARIQNPSPSPLSGGGSSAARRLFFPTPEVVPAASAGSGGFSLISLLFRHKRFEQEDPDSGSWLRSLFHRKKKPRRFSPPPAAAAAAAAIEKGLSPVEREESDGESESGYSTASSGAWRMPTPSPMRRAAGRQGVSGFGVCLSPLVRASPGRRRSKVSEAGFSGDLRGGPSQQLSQHQLRQVAGGGAALAANRSRKLADFGRFR